MAERFDIRERAKRLEATLQRLKARGASERERIDAVECAIRDALTARTSALAAIVAALGATAPYADQASAALRALDDV